MQLLLIAKCILCIVRILLESKNMLQGCEDDGETHAGNRMLHLMQVYIIFVNSIGAFQKLKDVLRTLDKCKDHLMLVTRLRAPTVPISIFCLSSFIA